MVLGAGLDSLEVFWIAQDSGYGRRRGDRRRYQIDRSFFPLGPWREYRVNWATHEGLTGRCQQPRGRVVGPGNPTVGVDQGMIAAACIPVSLLPVA